MTALHGKRHLVQLVCWNHLPLFIYGVWKYTDIVLFNPKPPDHNWIESIFFALTQYKLKKDPISQILFTLVNENIELEKYVAITTNKLLSFTKKWSSLLNN